MKHLGIVTATTAEARSLARHPLASGNVFLRISGVGAKRASSAAKALLEQGATSLLSWGSAGGLIPGLSPGSVVLPKVIVAVDGSVYSVNAAWHGHLCSQLKGKVDLHEGGLAESRTVVASPAEKSTLFRQTGAIAVDMESAALAAVAHEAGVPFIAIRAVVDPVGLTISRSALVALDEFGELRPLRLLKTFARHPIELPSLIRLGRDFRAAQITLAAVAALAGNHFLVPQ